MQRTRPRRSTPWTRTPEELFTSLNSSPSGLSQSEADARLTQYGPNTIEQGGRTSLFRILLRQFQSPLVYVLLAAMSVTMAIGHWSDAIVISIVIVINVLVGTAQEYRAENAMRALLTMVASKATVVRDGIAVDIPSFDIVPGDVVILEAGDVVPADLRVFTGSNLRVDESLLTGESVPVYKSTDVMSEKKAPVSDRVNMGHFGTSVVAGHARGLVIATAGNTEVGRIATAIRRTQRARTPLQDRMDRLGRLLTVGVLALAVIVFTIGLLQNRGLAEMFLTAVAIGVAAIPEGLPVVMTIALAVGIRRMASRNAVIRRLPAVETLGSCTTIFSDKTGTLTENRMTVREIRTASHDYRIGGASLERTGAISEVHQGSIDDIQGTLFRTLVAAALANEAVLQHPETPDGELKAQGDPTEVALLIAARKANIDHEQLKGHQPQVADVPFESERLFSASVHREPGGDLVTYVKGAPERIIEMCDQMEADDEVVPIDRPALLEQAKAMASEGLRVLGVAMGRGERSAQTTLSGESEELVYLGLVGMIDPPRPEAIEAVDNCRRAGIKVVMITGDHASTAAAIAREMNIVGTDESPVLTGSDIAEMSDKQVIESLDTTRVLARMSPAQKLRVVNLAKEHGEIVAVTGDGVNDAPALKTAHIGAAMGRTGTDVARESADLVVTDDNFATIYAAVEEGRTAFSNIRNASFFLIASGIGEAITIVSSLSLGYPLPILPAQILWLNVVTNGIQDVALAFEPGEPHQYRRPPRSPSEGVLSRVLVERSVLVGMTLAAGALFTFQYELNAGRDLAYAQVSVLTMLVMFEMIQVGNSRSETLSAFQKSLFSNRVLLIGCLLSVAVHVGAMHWGPAQNILRLEPLSLDTWLRILITSLSVLVVAEVHKLIRRGSFTSAARHR